MEKLRYFLILSACLCLTACSGGYSPPKELVPPDPAKCFHEASIPKSTGGKLKLDMAGCGSLRGTEAEFTVESINLDAKFRLGVGQEIILAPSYLVNYSVSLEISDGGEALIVGNVYLTVPFVSKLLSGNEYTTLDVSVFHKNEDEETSVIAQSRNEKDDDLKKVVTRLQQFGTYQPGVEINPSMDVGEIKNINFGSSQGSFLLQANGGEKFAIMLTDIPAGVVSGTLTSSSRTTPYTIEASDMPQAVSKPYYIPSKDVTVSGEAQSRVSIDALLHEKFKQRLESRSNRTQLEISPRLKVKASDIISFPNDPPIPGDVATGIIIWDYSDCAVSWYLPTCPKLLTGQSAVVHAVGNNSLVMVHDEDAYNGLISGGYGAALDDLSAAMDDIIYPRNTFFFGEPSDVDDNGRVIILLTHTLGGTGILGFYYMIDVFENDGVSWESGGFNDSNEADIIYSVFPSDDVHPLLLKNIIAHEFQHLINFKNKTMDKLTGYVPNAPVPAGIMDDPVNKTVPLEKLFTNEGLSHFAEDIAGYADVAAGIPHILNHPVANYAAYLKNNWRKSMIDTAGFGSIAMRAQNYLFYRYLFEQAGGAQPSPGTADYTDAGGAAFIKSVIASQYTGIVTLNNLLAGGFIEAYMDWLVALYNDKYDGTIVSLGKYNYIDSYSDEMTSQTVGIDMSSTREMADGSPYSPVEINGPTVKIFSGSNFLASEIATLGAGYAEYKLNPNPLKEVLRFAIVGSDNASFMGRIMRTE